MFHLYIFHLYNKFVMEYYYIHYKIAKIDFHQF